MDGGLSLHSFLDVCYKRKASYKEDFQEGARPASTNLWCLDRGCGIVDPRYLAPRLAFISVKQRAPEDSGQNSAANRTLQVLQVLQVCASRHMTPERSHLYDTDLQTSNRETHPQDRHASLQSRRRVHDWVSVEQRATGQRAASSALYIPVGWAT